MESNDTLEAPISARRRPKGDKRIRTRAALVDAARRIIRQEGYDALTLAAVAERAGMTTGAIYGNFKNRTDLLMRLSPLGRRRAETGASRVSFDSMDPFDNRIIL